jgi:hypothetical protein
MGDTKVVVYSVTVEISGAGIDGEGERMGKETLEKLIRSINIACASTNTKVTLVEELPA